MYIYISIHTLVYAGQMSLPPPTHPSAEYAATHTEEYAETCGHTYGLPSYASPHTGLYVCGDAYIQTSMRRRNAETQ
jgi:hypothetical protein